jgi:hypothetical protein
MAHISSIGAGMYSDLSVSKDAALLTSVNAAILAKTGIETAFKNCFTASEFTGADALRILNVREFPSMGTPPNIVNVPVYGQATSQQIQGQSDAPSMELTLNYVAKDWAAGSGGLGDMVGDGKQYVFRFTLLNAEPPNHASASTGLGQVDNSQYFWVGKLEALLVNPQLTDANTATLTISMQSDMYGAYTDAST